MSAKGRAASGYVPDPNGFFSTQPRVTRAILPHLGIRPGMRILEPSCGKGAIARVLREEYGKTIVIVGIEIDKRRAAQARKAKVGELAVFDLVEATDLFKVKPEEFEAPFDIAITNPSFSIWLPVAEHCFQFAPTTTLLLPLNAISSKKRSDWWRAHPAHLRVLSKRPSFAISVKCILAKKKQCSYQELIALDAKPKKQCPLCGERTETTSSDASEYCWATWGPEITRGLWDPIDTPEEAQ
jgi:SAM-dependent methyltransferase